MNQQRYFLIIVVLLMVLLTACKKDKTICVEYKSAFIGSYTAPASGNVNTDINFVLNYPVYNGCAKSDSIETATHLDTTTISIKVKYEGCECTQVYGFASAFYIFRSATPGTYYFRFMQENGSYLFHTLVIQ